MLIELQEWIHLISDADRKKLSHVFRIDSHPMEFVDLMCKLRERYDFIPPEIPLDKADQK